ncbi:MAG: hypothetical protein WAP20_07875 [Limnochordia bacterium]|jgi:hypothetical protein|nr:hypothetical protein [Bacillota bacterium]HOB09589.1 hypothetical protein [Limnochordia bacterium]NLH31931.1 hypothetical protein [Bacillota bacterium]HPT93304.1 hypothetical protein [Limnochordia bacterium]HPZ31528.1 hypothetical protein [Limnochordia bacterium]
MKANSANVVVTALGAAVSGIGYTLMRRSPRSRFASGLLGFGLAHVALGMLDMSREKTPGEVELTIDLE